jgi:hypothetical protein
MIFVGLLNSKFSICFLTNRHRSSNANKVFCVQIFFRFFRPRKKRGEKVRKNITHLSKSLYCTISFANVRFVSTGHIGKDEPFLLTISFVKELN